MSRIQDYNVNVGERKMYTIRNTAEEVLKYTRLTFKEVQPTEVEQLLEFAAAEVEFISPEDDSDRSTRAEPLRKHAECCIVASGLFEMLSNQAIFEKSELFGKSRILKEIAIIYQNKSEQILQMIRPIVACIVAG